jgi:glycosyltransferase involved in cell wall biosynthesis
MLLERLDALANSPEMASYQVEYLFVNDGSTDSTYQLLQAHAQSNKRISYINLSRNFGKEISMMAGIDHVQADAVVIIDADLQDPPELIPEMVKYWEEGYDDVYARRASRKGESAIKKWTSKTYYRVLQKSTRIPIQRDTGDFRLLDKRCIEALRELREKQRNMKALFSWIGYKKKEITYDRDPRAAGGTKWNYFKLISLAIDGITTFTTAPLRLATLFGFIISPIALIYGAYLVLRTLIFGTDLSGYVSTFTAIIFFGGVQLLSIGILGEYIGRIFLETKERPLYLIENAHYSEGQLGK